MLTSPFHHRAFFSWRSAGLVIAAVVLWLASIEPPAVPNPGLDGSWQAALVDAFVHDRQFGTELVFTYGPWAFLGLGGYVPAALEAKILWEILGRLIYAATVVLLSAGFPGVRRVLFLAGMMVAAFFFETSALAFITITALAWLVPRDAALWKRALAIAWLSFFAHFKFVFFVHAVAAMTIALALRCAEKRFRTAGGLLLGFAVAYSGWWLAAGQNLANLPAFWRQSAEISRGYSWAMGIDPATSTLLVGFLVFGFCGGFFWLLIRSEMERIERIGVGLILAMSWLIAWKQGFTRADLHAVGFFVFCLLIGLALPGFLRLRGWRWQDANFVACLAGVALLDSSLLVRAPRLAWARCLEHPGEVLRLREWPRRLETSLRAARDAAHDPVLRATVGRGTVDVLNFGQGLALLNELNYRPRPVIQSYSAYTSALAQLNAEFFRSERAPEFVMINLTTVDNRYPAQEDALALAECARRYQIVRADADFLLLRRRPKASPPADEVRQSLARHVPHWGEEISVPDGKGHPVWLQIEFHPTWLGRLRAFFYHASNPNLTITREGRKPCTFRILPTTSADGFFLTPLVENHAQLASLMLGRGTNWPTSLRCDLAKPTDRWFWRRPRLHFSALTGMPLVHGDRLDDFVEGRAVNLRPLSVRSDVAIDLTGAGKHALLFAHATSEVVLPVSPDLRRLTGGCGFMESAYLSGQTDGADFQVEARLVDGATVNLLQRSLQPITRAQDRGFQPFNLELPAGTVRLSLRITPGARGDTSWDWTYWGDLQLLP